LATEGGSFTTTTSPTPVGAITTTGTTVYDLHVPAGTVRYQVVAVAPPNCGPGAANGPPGTANDRTFTAAAAPLSTRAEVTSW